MNPRNALYAVLAAVSVAFVACQQPDQPTAPGSTGPQASPTPSGSGTAMDGGRAATPEEVKHLLSLPVSQAAPSAGETPATGALAKSAATPYVYCTIGFNSSNALSYISDHGYSTFILDPWYYETCGNTSYYVRTAAVNVNHFHLVPEAADQCFGPQPYWGHNGAGGACVNQSDAMYWPRRVANMAGNTGVVFNAYYKNGPLRNMDLRAMYVYSGTVKVLAYRVGIGWWYWPNLTASQRWYWTGNNTNLSEIRVFDTNENGVFTIDNLEVGIYY